MDEQKMSVFSSQDETLYNSGQSWHYHKVIALADGRRLRASIRRNAYDFQSYARVELFDGAKWQVIDFRPIAVMACADVSYTDRHVFIGPFRRDAETLFALGRNVLGVSA